MLRLIATEILLDVMVSHLIRFWKVGIDNASELCEAAGTLGSRLSSKPIPTTWRLAVAYQLSGPG
eukprot:4832513-Prymnesium_polylepis.1